MHVFKSLLKSSQIISLTILSNLQPSSVSTSWNEGIYLKNTFSLDENKLLLVGISEKWGKNGFH